MVPERLCKQSTKIITPNPIARSADLDLLRGPPRRSIGLVSHRKLEDPSVSVQTDILASLYVIGLNGRRHLAWAVNHHKPALAVKEHDRCSYLRAFAQGRQPRT